MCNTQQYSNGTSSGNRQRRQPSQFWHLCSQQSDPLNYSKKKSPIAFRQQGQRCTPPSSIKHSNMLPMAPNHLCISDNLLLAPRIYLQRYPKSPRWSSKSETYHMYMHVLHSSLIQGFSGILRSLLNSWSNFTKWAKTLCFLQHHFFPAVDLLSANSLSQQSALTARVPLPA